MVLARGPETAAALGQAFAARLVDKRYLALVVGRVKRRGAVNRPLEQRRAGRADLVARDVRTRYRLREAFAHWSLVEVTIEGGKTHQIRRHMAMVRHALAGDRRYGERWRNERIARETGLDRLFLHADTLALAHPRTGAALRFEAPLPAELAAALDRLRS